MSALVFNAAFDPVVTNGSQRNFPSRTATAIDEMVPPGMTDIIVVAAFGWHTK